MTIQGQRQYLWRAVDHDGDLIDILVQPRRDQRAAERFFRKLLKGQERKPRAHLAHTIWPNRVRTVYNTDRSIAIAHGLEELCETKAPESKKRANIRGKRNCGG